MYTGEYAMYCMTHCQSHPRVRYRLLNLANFLQFVHTLFYTNGEAPTTVVRTGNQRNTCELIRSRAEAESTIMRILCIITIILYIIIIIVIIMLTITINNIIIYL